MFLLITWPEKTIKNVNPPAVVKIKHFKCHRKACLGDAEEGDEEDEPDHIKNETSMTFLDHNKKFQLE